MQKTGLLVNSEHLYMSEQGVN